MQKSIFLFGAIAGLTVSTTLVVMMLIHRQNPVSSDSGEFVGYLSMLLSASLIPVAVKSYRDRHQAGQISFKDAFLIGLGVATIASVMYVVTWVAFYKLVYPDFGQVFTRSTLDKLKASGTSAADLVKARQDMQAMFSYYDTWYGLIGITFMEIFPIGLLVALVSALILKRGQSEPVAA